MQKRIITIVLLFVFGMFSSLYGAYHHMDEQDSPKFQQAYPELIGTKLDDCALCHSGGEYEKNPGKFVTVGSCQWCHMTYGYDGNGDISETMNPYGNDYLAAGRSVSAFFAIESPDSDNDTYSNKEELDAVSYPGNPDDDPSKVPAPRIVYTLSELEELPVHTQFLLMNTSRGGTDGNDYYTEYQGVTLETLLAEAGMLSQAESISVFAPDGWSQTFDLESGGENYYVSGEYPQATYYYDPEADAVNGGWVDYSSPGCQGREHGQAIINEEGLECMLAYMRDGVYLDIGALDAQNRLVGEGPYRVVPPQKKPGPPDQLATSPDQDVIWPYDGDELETDHNAGNSPRTSTAIRIEPLPEGTTDFNWNEGGWTYADNSEIIIYGALRNGAVEGVVTDAVNGQPIEKARITTDRGGYTTLTDVDGVYNLSGVVCGQDKATYTLTVSANGYSSQSQDLEVAHEETVVADFALSTGTDNATTCPVEAVADQDTITLFRLFRDRVLKKTLQGKTYRILYYEFAPEITQKIVSSPALRAQAAGTLTSFAATVARLTAGGKATITAGHIQKIRELFVTLKKDASPGLLQVLKRLERDLDNKTILKVFNVCLEQ